MELFYLIIYMLLSIALVTITTMLFIEIFKKNPNPRIPFHLLMLAFALFFIFSLLSFNITMEMTKEYKKGLESNKENINFEVIFEKDTIGNNIIKLEYKNDYPL